MTDEGELGMVGCDAPATAGRPGAEMVGAALFEGTCTQDGVSVTRVEHRAWTVVLPGHSPIRGVDARRAVRIVDRYFRDRG